MRFTIARMALFASALLFAGRSARAEEPAATPSPTPATAPATEPAPDFARGSWELSGSLESQGVFDPGVHLFSRNSWLEGAGITARRAGGGEGLRAGPELGYAFLDDSRDDLAAKTTSRIDLHRVSLGVRASVPLGRSGVRVFGRTGVEGVLSTASVDDPYRTHTRTALGAGGYASAGLEAELAVRSARGPRIMVALEAGHTLVPRLDYGPWGTLAINGASFSASVGFRF